LSWKRDVLYGSRVSDTVLEINISDAL
jgi:hypothetical protein